MHKFTKINKNQRKKFVDVLFFIVPYSYSTIIILFTMGNIYIYRFLKYQFYFSYNLEKQQIYENIEGKNDEYFPYIIIVNSEMYIQGFVTVLDGNSQRDETFRHFSTPAAAVRSSPTITLHICISFLPKDTHLTIYIIYRKKQRMLQKIQLYSKNV